MFLFTYFKRYQENKKDEDEVTDDTLDKWDDELPEFPEVVLHVPEIIVQEPSQDIKKEKEIQAPVYETEISNIRTKDIKEEKQERTEQPESTEIPIFYATCTYPTRTPHIMEETLEWILGEVAFLQFMYYHSHH